MMGFSGGGRFSAGGEMVAAGLLGLGYFLGSWDEFEPIFCSLNFLVLGFGPFDVSPPPSPNIFVFIKISSFAD